MGQDPSLCTSGRRMRTRCSVCHLSVPALGLVPGSGCLSIVEGRVGWGRDSLSSPGSVMPQPGHTQDTWPAASKGGWGHTALAQAEPHSLGKVEIDDDGTADAEGVGLPFSCSRSPHGPSCCPLIWLALKPS